MAKRKSKADILDKVITREARETPTLENSHSRAALAAAMVAPISRVLSYTSIGATLFGGSGVGRSAPYTVPAPKPRSVDDLVAGDKAKLALDLEDWAKEGEVVTIYSVDGKDEMGFTLYTILTECATYVQVSWTYLIPLE